MRRGVGGLKGGSCAEHAWQRGHTTHCGLRRHVAGWCGEYAAPVLSCKAVFSSKEPQQKKSNVMMQAVVQTVVAVAVSTSELELQGHQK